MIILLSPAKTLDFDFDFDRQQVTKPQFHADANRLAAEMKSFSKVEIEDLMNVSSPLAETVCLQFQSWKKKFDPLAARPAIRAYRGDVYQGLEAQTLKAKGISFAQRHLRILSGLYGLLRPYDLIQPYRLEMGLRLRKPVADSLYEFWGSKLTNALRHELDTHTDRIVVNLASAEYDKCIDTKRLDAEWIAPKFKEEKDGKIRFLSFYGKKARGMLARYLIDNQARTSRALEQFNVEGYRLNSKLSRPQAPVFSRPQPKPLSA